MEKKQNHLSAFQEKRILITGGLGFIGSNLAHCLAAVGAQVTLVDSLIPEYGGNLFNIAGIKDQVCVNISDVRDEFSMRYLVQDKDILFNLAGQTSHLDSMNDPYTDLDINCRAQLTILETCRKYNPDIKIVFASTRQIYGKPTYLPVDEKHLLQPVDVNGINKMAGEWYHILYNNVYNLRACALRLTNTYGPRMRIKDARQTFLGIWISRIMQGLPIDVWGGSQLRDFTFIDDVIDALLLVAMSEFANGKAYNLGGDSTITLKDLAELLIKIHGSGQFEIHEYPAERKKIDIGDYYANYELIKNELGWSPQVKLEDGLLDTLEYYQRHLGQYL